MKKSITGVISIVLGLILFSGSSCASKADRPNIIVFLADDMGWGDAACYGNDKIATPERCCQTPFR